VRGKCGQEAKALGVGREDTFTAKATNPFDKNRIEVGSVEYLLLLVVS